jgi:hypothetical protein
VVSQMYFYAWIQPQIKACSESIHIMYVVLMVIIYYEIKDFFYHFNKIETFFEVNFKSRQYSSSCCIHLVL